MEQPLTKVSEGPSDGTWDLHRSTIKRLYVDEDKTLPQVMEIMKCDYDFKASIKMYKRRLGLWKFDGKNLKRSEVKQIARQKVERDAVGKSSKFFIKGREVDMNNVQRYLKKHGYSGPEDYLHAASPVASDSDVECATPAQSPMSSEMEFQGVESQDILQSHDAGSLQCNQSFSVRLSTTGRHLISTQKLSRVQNFLSLSPETRSRRLLSLSPIPRTPALPKALSIPEQILSNLSLYLKASFESGVWETGANGKLISKKALDSKKSSDWTGSCSSAIELHKERKYVQFRQMMSQTCRKMELGIRYESPNAMIGILYSNKLLRDSDLPDVASIILRHAYSVAATYSGASYPVAQMCGALQKLDVNPSELHSRLFECQLDLLEKEIGPWHLSTSKTRSYLFWTVDKSEAVGRARASLAEYELTGLKYDDIWFESMINLAQTLVDDRQYGNASRVCRDTLDAVDTAIDFAKPRATKAEVFWQLSLIADYAVNDIMEAEGYMQLAIAAVAAARGSQDSSTIRFMLYRASLLRELGRFDEAGEIETQIQDILGPPEIEELLS